MSRDGLGAFLTILDVSAFLLQSLGLETVVDFVGLAFAQSLARGTILAFAFTRGTSPLGAGDGMGVETVAVRVGCGCGFAGFIWDDTIQSFFTGSELL